MADPLQEIQINQSTRPSRPVEKSVGSPDRSNLRSPYSVVNPYSPIRNPYKHDGATTNVTRFATATAIVSPTSAARTSVSVGSTWVPSPSQIQPNEQTRKRAAELQVELDRNKKIAPQCARCNGVYSDNNLCIKWTHECSIQRDVNLGNGSLGKDSFRYSCCGKIDSQPCFVGR